jgi:hypothetical protein
LRSLICLRRQLDPISDGRRIDVSRRYVMVCYGDILVS